MKFDEIEDHLLRFWRELSHEHRALFAEVPEVAAALFQQDAVLYDTIIHLMLPNALKPLPLEGIQAIRQFAAKYEQWVTIAMAGHAPTLVARKCEIAKVLVQQLRRHTALNHLAQAGRQVVGDPQRLAAMLSDWNLLTFSELLDQAAWVCECRARDIHPILDTEVRHLLATGNQIEQWGAWVEGVANRFLDEGLEPQRYIYVARQVLLKWTYYANAVLRDLTFHSAPSYGSFHLVFLFCDAFFFYLVEQRIANMKAFEQR
ncbi:hypothetical protein CXG81DRAFT_10930 [Caulochytrium protostelioides]|uniref:RFX1-4/6/8-like BCD domain-containing protein n=1 Tax=Caulochytrium protostelioides TaxID=1555241 RepID=A0A4P9XAG7_9FUNG|nr:hypothetical protein CXG81DRAFT_10930 [Caulochytrium protostelioides]|eukprot:RKP02348.1 hypothetical protein CXG81DRAFT_10930 [Caulochytrium protostelioides]